MRYLKKFITPPQCVTLLLYVTVLTHHQGWCKFGDDKTKEFEEIQRLGYSGWMGYGGSVLQWHEKQDIAFGYAMNLMEREMNNARGLALQRVVLKCVKAQDDY